MKLDYRLALDLGANSIGWCVYRVRPREDTQEGQRWQITALHRMGARIFSDGRNPKDLTSLAASRRLARQARRRRDRALQRKSQLLDQLVSCGLMPLEQDARKALVQLDPYELRANGLGEALHPHHFGRALFHLARKRGFRSGRKDLSEQRRDKEAGKIHGGIASLKAKIAEAGCATVGQYLARRHAKRESVLARPETDGSYAMYLARELVAEEFDKLWAQQSLHHPRMLTPQVKERLRHTILFQRKLRPVTPGQCLLERTEFRAHLAHPLSQRFRILQELANLRIRSADGRENSLTLEQRNQLLDALENGRSINKSDILPWTGIRSILKLQGPCDFNLNCNGRRGLKADIVSTILSSEAALGTTWHRWSADEQDRFIHQMREVDNRGELDAALADYQLSESQLDTVFRALCKMPDEFGSLSLKALQKIVPILESGVVAYSDAVIAAGYKHHSHFYDGELWKNLPYYGRLLRGYTQPRDVPGASKEEREDGRIPNPTVHVGLNQLRRVVNAIIRRYGRPKQIIIEVARELGLSGDNRRKLAKEQLANRETNERFDLELESLGLRKSRENRQRLRLFEELTRNDPLGAECIYTGERISRAKLFSDEVEIDHILPFSKSLDDGIGNKVLCLRRANRDKKDRTPYEAFGGSASRYQWDAILARAERLGPRKARRFQEHALEAFLQDRDFLDRHLNDTAYFSRVAREYLTAICPPNCIWVSTGRLTEMIRGKWGFNRILSDFDRKNRSDHRHHAVDAAVIGACDRSLIKAISDAARRAEFAGEHRVLEGLDPPWPTFFDEIRTTISKVIVSHKPEHGLSGRLHNETIYGLAQAPDAKGRAQVVHRVPLTSLKGRSEIEIIVDASLRADVLEAVAGKESSEFKAALCDYSARTGVRRVRVVERWSVQSIANPGREKPNYVRTDGNYCYEVVRRPNGRWAGYAVSLLEASRVRRFDKTSGIRGDPLVMRLHVNDMVITRRNAGEEAIFRVVKLSDSKIALAEHFEAGALKSRDADAADSFKYLNASPTSLYESKARVVTVDELGYVNDPGFRP